MLTQAIILVVKRLSAATEVLLPCLCFSKRDEIKFMLVSSSLTGSNIARVAFDSCHSRDCGLCNP